MLKKFTILFCLFLVTAAAFSQNAGSSRSSYQKVVNGDCLEIYLSDSSGYIRMEETNKKMTLEAMIRDTGVQRVVVRYGYMREVWVRDPKLGLAFVSKKNVNEFAPVKFQKYSDKEYSMCDFFSYAGFAMDFTSSRFSFTIASRFGCYFLKRLLDCSITYSYSVTTMGLMSSSSMSLGLMARVYPFYKTEALRKICLSPYIGIEGAYTPSFVNGNRTDAGNFIGHVGVSWLIGPGSLDVGFQAGITEYFAATIGYSFCPSLLTHHRKSSKK